ncbi:ABC transporter ATP-binding protein [Gammaproteobacteria bacterium AB-CW1]|uniref:ABC transporter ATP-binding protein n=1 Tax=Natronospira elongata TaxID=3110268 RepID=A0AAP6JHA2_9GAMM|nr:ABC transporter ATP-binding protein [Gammaproteobacteria bacterium AB-CW1]
MATCHSMLGFEDVSCRRGGKTVLQDVHLSCKRGETLALLGPNGAGKTSTIGLALGLLRPSAGRIHIDGHAPGSLAARQTIGAMLQGGRPAQAMTVREWLMLAGAGRGQPSPLDEAIQMADIEDLLERQCETLSGGQLQRARLAAALAGQPRLLFLDEPTAGMDIDSRHRLWAGVGRLRENGCAILITTHDLDEAEQLSDRVALLHEGRVIACDHTAHIGRRVPGRVIRCRTRLEEATLAAWPDVEGVRLSGGHTTLMVRDAEAVLRRLLAADPELSALEVRNAGLEEAFLHLIHDHREQAA